MNKVKVVAIDGSPRSGSASRKLLRGTKEFFERSGAKFGIFDQSEERLPLFDDSDQGAAHPTVSKLVTMVRDADAIVFSSPEYHGSMSGALKNAFDWLTLLGHHGRLRGKAVGLMGGGGTLGNSGATLQMMMAVRSLHGVLMPEVIVSVPSVWDAFDETGNLRDLELKKRVQEFAEKLTKYADLLKSNRQLFQ